MAKHIDIEGETFIEATRGNRVCQFCDLQHDIGDSMCATTERAAGCWCNKRTRFKPEIVGPDYVPIEKDEARLRNLQSLINDRGLIWHPNIDADGHLGRLANNLIDRGILKAPRGRLAKHMRTAFLLRQASGGWNLRSAS
jgi:hypothetical protein